MLDKGDLGWLSLNFFLFYYLLVGYKFDISL